MFYYSLIFKRFAELKIDKTASMCVCVCVFSRALKGRWQRGGNASNLCTVLRQLGNKCEFMGPLSNSKAFSFLIEDCHDRGIQIDHCVYHSAPIAPFSSVILNEATGSRTIVHSNADMPMLTADDFRKIPFENYGWIHFEVCTSTHICIPVDQTRSHEMRTQPN